MGHLQRSRSHSDVQRDSISAEAASQEVWVSRRNEPWEPENDHHAVANLLSSVRNYPVTLAASLQDSSKRGEGYICTIAILDCILVMYILFNLIYRLIELGKSL